MKNAFLVLAATLTCHPCDVPGCFTGWCPVVPSASVARPRESCEEECAGLYNQWGFAACVRECVNGH